MTKTSRQRAPDKKTIRGLTDMAKAVARRAYAPYSKFRVGAVVLASSGEIYQGVNIENASYGIGTCAERVALAAAKAAGESRIEVVVVACIDATNAPLSEKVPCGACRQWIQELAPDATIVIAGAKRRFTIGELLPYPFRLKKRQKQA